MLKLASAAVVLTAVSMTGCDRSTAPLEPMAAEAKGKPETDPTYANGTTVYMIGPKVIPDARNKMPNAYEHAEELYFLVFPQASTPAPGAGPITLPSGYQPQCDPCFHPGLPLDFVYHDHVITGAPGMGRNGTAGEYLAPWKIIVLVYNPAYVASADFTPLKSEAEIDAAEEAGNVFLPINPGGENPYEVDTGNLLICPTVSSHA